MNSSIATGPTLNFHGKLTDATITDAEERRFYSPERKLESINNHGNPGIYRVLELIRPVAAGTDMLQVLDIFRDHKQEHFFPVLDAEGRPVGLVCERSLKTYVYSRYGLALLANRSQAKELDHFLTPCPSVEIDASTDQVLESAHQVAGAEGVLVTADGCYVGFVRASSLVELAHEQQMETIRQHNIALDQKNREIQAVLQNMRQGICTLLPDTSLHSGYSAHLGSILENNDLAGRSIMQVLFRFADVGPDQLQQIESALMAILDQDELMYDCNSHLLPTELRCAFNERKKILELHWSPVTDAHGQVSRLMLVVRDVSEMRQLQQQAAVQQRELQLLGEILTATEQRFRQFMQGSEILLSDCKQLLGHWRSDDVEDANDMLAALYRNLHTIKGNARTLGLNAVTDSLHEAEQILQLARESNSVLNGAQMRDALNKVEADFLQYRELYEKRLQGFVSDQKATHGNRVVSEEGWLALQQMAESRQDGALCSLLAKADSLPLNGLFENILPMVSTLSAELAKTCPHVRISAGIDSLRVVAQHYSLLESVVTHIVRNCMDHGIETVEERLLAGKSEIATIRVDVEADHTGTTVVIADDGRGLALAKLRRKGMALGLISEGDQAGDDEVAALIFHAGLSTAEQVSMISGRGVGMDAVRNSLAHVGASITVEWTDGNTSPTEYRPFGLRIHLPESIVI